LGDLRVKLSKTQDSYVQLRDEKGHAQESAKAELQSQAAECTQLKKEVENLRRHLEEANGRLAEVPLLRAKLEDALKGSAAKGTKTPEDVLLT
jgi:uncharacterized coiled-coil DUF342 family protein